MQKKVIVGIVFLIFAVFLFLQYSSLGEYIPDLGLPEKDGKIVECSLEIDKDSIHSSSCQSYGECRTSTYSSRYQALFQTDVQLTLNAGGKQALSESITVSSLGANEDITIQACVLQSTTQGTFTLRDEQNRQVAQKVAIW